MLLKKCLLCKKIIKAKYPSQIRKKKYCSFECSVIDNAEKRKVRVLKKCLYCKKPFEVKKSLASKRECCSRACGDRIWSERMSGEKHFNWKEVKSKPKRYLWIQGQYAHRVIMERHLGRKLKPNEVVHHKNDNPTDNRLKNLQLMTKGDHMKLHFGKGDLC